MAEEKEIPEITNDDLHALNYLLQNVKGISMVSESHPYIPEDQSDQ